MTAEALLLMLLVRQVLMWGAQVLSQGSSNDGGRVCTLRLGSSIAQQQVEVTSASGGSSIQPCTLGQVDVYVALRRIALLEAAGTAMCPISCIIIFLVTRGAKSTGWPYTATTRT
jgi:hypothetical protein